MNAAAEDAVAEKAAAKEAAGERAAAEEKTTRREEASSAAVAANDASASAVAAANTAAEKATGKKPRAAAEVKAAAAAAVEEARAAEAGLSMLGRYVHLSASDGPGLEGCVGCITAFDGASGAYAVRVPSASGGASSSVCVPQSRVRVLSPACLALLAEGAASAAGSVGAYLLAPPNEFDEMVELRVLEREKRFFHAFIKVAAADPSGAAPNETAYAFAMAAIGERACASPTDQKCTYHFETDAAYLLAASASSTSAASTASTASWDVHLTSVSSRGVLFALSDESADLYGAATGAPRRELGLLSLPAKAGSGHAVPMQFVIPRVAGDGTAIDFRPRR